MLAAGLLAGVVSMPSFIHGTLIRGYRMNVVHRIAATLNEKPEQQEINLQFPSPYQGIVKSREGKVLAIILLRYLQSSEPYTAKCLLSDTGEEIFIEEPKKNLIPTLLQLFSENHRK